MIKRHIVETVETFDKETGLLTEKVTTTTDEEDDNPTTNYTYVPAVIGVQDWSSPYGKVVTTNL